MISRFSQIGTAKLLKTFCQSIGLASLILVLNYGDLLGGGGDERMHVPFALASICLAQITSILLLGLILFVLLVLIRLTRFYPFVRLFLAIIVPPYMVQCLRNILPVHFNIRWIGLGMIAWGAFVLLLLFRYSLAYRRLIRFGNAAGIFLAIFAACSIAQLLYVTRWRPGPHSHTVAWAVTAQPPRTHPKIVWVLFDELSFDQLFQHRAKDLLLPNFDALRAQSTLFTDTQPIGLHTVKILPGLLSGHVVEDYRFTLGNRLLVHDTDGHGFHVLNGAGTVFGDAKQQGWRTSVVGWYNPYCTIYAGAIDDCYWMNQDRLDGNMAQDATFWQNTLAPLKQVALQIAVPAQAGRDTCNFAVQQRLKTFLDLQSHALATLRDDQSDFVFLHMPVPHSPNIWSRATGAYTHSCDSSYLDNLALADRTLGQIMQILQSSPRWKDTTVIVEGDHSWRIFLWNWLPAWTNEDDAASQRGFDPRPAMIIHQAGQTQPQTDPQPWSILRVHAFVEQVLHGQHVSF